MRILGVDFVPIATADFAGALEFYGGVLGLRCQGVSPRRTHAEFDAGGLTLQVVDAGGAFRPSPHPVALRVADVPAARAELERRGVAFTGETLDTGFCLTAPFADPGGNALALHQRYVPRGA